MKLISPINTNLNIMNLTVNKNPIVKITDKVKQSEFVLLYDKNAKLKNYCLDSLGVKINIQG